MYKVLLEVKNYLLWNLVMVYYNFFGVVMYLQSKELNGLNGELEDNKDNVL